MVTGATGFVGREVCQRLQSPRVLTRTPETAPPEFSEYACFRWRPMEETPPREALEDCEAIFHLAGEPVATGRWTRAKKARIRDSRVVGTRNLVQGIRSLDQPPKVLVSASAVGFYGSEGDTALTEQAGPGSGFLSDVCQEWELEAMRAQECGTRVVLIRVGLVLGRGGGALAKLLPIFRIGAGGRLGNGSQWMPWIHLSDLADLFAFSAKDSNIRGAVNGTAPQPVTNRAFTTAMSRALRRPALLPAPKLGLRLALGEFASVLMASQRVVPERASKSGFEFAFETIDDALSEIVGQRP